DVRILHNIYQILLYYHRMVRTLTVHSMKGHWTQTNVGTCAVPAKHQMTILNRLSRKEQSLWFWPEGHQSCAVAPWITSLVPSLLAAYRKPACHGRRSDCLPRLPLASTCARYGHHRRRNTHRIPAS